MAKVLVRIKRTEAFEFFGGGNFRRHPNVIHTEKVQETDDPMTRAEFFEVDEADAKAAVQEFALKNPGRTVQVFGMTMEGICPPGELVLKNVGKDGVLPA